MDKKLTCIEMEIHSFCNRHCPWCPNRDIDRSFYEELPEEIFISLLDSLKKMEFNGIISIAGYSEPMANIELLKKRINQIREVLPSVFIKINTNGDFLSKENLKDLYLNKINVQDYDGIGEQACIEKATKSGIFIVKKDTNTNKIFGLHSNVDYIEYRVNWQKNNLLDNRGGYFSYSENINDISWREKDKQRTEVCVEPIYGLYINYNGIVSPCCEIREDYDKHKQFVLGNLHFNNLNEILESDKYKDFINVLLEGDILKYPSPCLYCHKVTSSFIKDKAEI